MLREYGNAFWQTRSQRLEGRTRRNWENQSHFFIYHRENELPCVLDTHGHGEEGDVMLVRDRSV